MQNSRQKNENKFHNMEYEYWFAGIPKLTDRKKRRLKERFESAEAIYYIEETKLCRQEFLNEEDVHTIRQARREVRIKDNYERYRECGMYVLVWGEDDYPEKLLHIADPPYVLYGKGAVPDPKQRSGAIVGARRCSPYGETYALEFGKVMAEYGIEVISGLARGVDGFGQRGALLENGKTFAVLGCGPDICYPKDNIGLYMDILEQGGGILSEFSPGTPPLPRHFPKRNRIISGLSDFVLVIEARKKSGSLITADLALEQGRDVFALPGPVNSGLSQGCNELIRQGAGILTSPQTLLEDLGIRIRKTESVDGLNSDKNKKTLESPENMVYSCVGLYPKSLGQLSDETKLEPGEVLNLLVSLELQGYIREISKNYYIRVK